MSKGRAFACVVGLVTAFAPAWAHSTVINFDDQGLTGPSLFASVVISPQHYDIGTGPTVSFDGGAILTNTAFLPADQTSVYGTASFKSGLTNPLTVSFDSPITNFFLDVYNGQTFNVTYRVSDNNGNSADFELAPNLSGGQTTIGFAATGTIVTIQALNAPSSWDFFIDNVHFNEELPAAVPEPSTLLLLGSGIAVLARRKRRAARE